MTVQWQNLVTYPCCWQGITGGILLNWWLSGGLVGLPGHAPSLRASQNSHTFLCRGGTSPLYLMCTFTVTKKNHISALPVLTDSPFFLPTKNYFWPSVYLYKVPAAGVRCAWQKPLWRALWSVGFPRRRLAATCTVLPMGLLGGSWTPCHMHGECPVSNEALWQLTDIVTVVRNNLDMIPSC